MAIVAFSCFSFGLADLRAADISPPQLVSADFTPKSLDVSGTAQTITFTARFTDESGVNGTNAPQAHFKSPSGQQGAAAILARSSGTANDGIYQGVITVPKSAEAGIWKIDFVFATDIVGNQAFYGSGVPLPPGTPTDLIVSSAAPDTSPPQLVSGDFTPKSVNVSDAAQTITFTVRLTDVSGVDEINRPQAHFKSPSGAQKAGTILGRTSGSAMDGIYQGNITIPRSAEPGTWKVDFVSARDVVNNQIFYGSNALLPAGVPTDLVVSSPTPDVTPPALASADFMPKGVDVSDGAQSIVFSARFTDASGVDETNQPQAHFKSPSGTQGAATILARTSGSVNDGVYQGSITIPKSAETGIWKINFIFAQDIVSNNVFYGSSQLLPTGTPTTLSVSSSTAAVKIISIRKLNGGSYLLNGKGVPSSNHLVQSTEDFSKPFNTVATIAADASGNLEFEDTSTENISKRFYRFAYQKNASSPSASEVEMRNVRHADGEQIKMPPAFEVEQSIPLELPPSTEAVAFDSLILSRVRVEHEQYVLTGLPHFDGGHQESSAQIQLIPSRNQTEQEAARVHNRVQSFLEESILRARAAGQQPVR